MKLHKLASMFASTSIALSAFADDHGGDSPDYLSPFNVIGTKADVSELKGSGAVLDSSDLKPFMHTDIHEILRQVPGVYVRGEEGYGFFPNISLRGVEPNRSNKITILEDGVPSAPSPYADPAAYYAPTAGRMAGFEILKGASQLKYGPNTTGGVINYLSTPIPNEQKSYLRGSYGDNAERISHAYSGGKLDFAGGKLGYLLEVFDHRSDGWKTIDGRGNTPSRNAPVERSDMQLKLSYEYGDGGYIEFKAGRMDMDADVSYQGLLKEHFNVNPYSRYVGTHQDNMDAQQNRYYLRFKNDLTDSLSLTTTIYRNEFTRKWYKLGDKYYATSTDDAAGTVTGKPYGTFLNTTANYTTLGGTLKGIDSMTGTVGEIYRVKTNYRVYETDGIQANFDWNFGIHDFDIGFRFQDDHYYKHEDGTDSTSDSDVVTWTAGGYEFAPGTKTYVPDYKDAEAFEAYLVDDIDLGNLSLSPGVRYSSIDNQYKAGKIVNLDDVILGIGAQYNLSENLSIFGGVHQGHTFPDAESAADEGMVEEESLNFEIGARGTLGVFAYEAVYFNTKLENMLFLASQSTGLEATLNAGEGSTQGVEVLIATDLANREQGISFPLSLSATFTDTEFETGTGKTGSAADAEESYIYGATKGKAFPYIPDLMFNIRSGLEFEKFATYLNYHWQDSVFTNAQNDHSIDSYGVLDWSGFYEINDGVTAFAKVTNLTEEEYAVSILPGGYRPGAPQIWSLGMEFDF